MYFLVPLIYDFESNIFTPVHLFLKIPFYKNASSISSTLTHNLTLMPLVRESRKQNVS